MEESAPLEGKIESDPVLTKQGPYKAPPEDPYGKIREMQPWGEGAAGGASAAYFVLPAARMTWLATIWGRVLQAHHGLRRF